MVKDVKNTQDTEDNNGALTHDAAIERVYQARMDMFPVFLKKGLIRSSNGWYRLGLHDDGRIALLYARNKQDFDGIAKDDQKGTYPDPDKKIWVVDAKPSRTSAKWVTLAILRHQEHLAVKQVKKGMLYQTNEDTWQNEAVSYKIFPVEQENSDEEQKYTLRLYSRAKAEDNFVAVDETAPKGFFGNVFSLGQNEGTYTRVEAKKRITQDFNERAQRIKQGIDPLTIGERKRSPKLWFSRLKEKYQTAVVGMPMHKKITIGLETAMTGILSLINPAELITKAASIMVGFLSKTFIKDPVQLNIAESLGVKKKGWSFKDMQCIEADPKKIADFRYLNAKEAKANYDNMPVYTELSPTWAKEYILGAAHGRPGGVAYPREDGVLSIQENNGLLVYYVPNSNTAFARLRPEWKQDGADALPPEVEAMFKDNAEDVLKISKKDDERFKCEFMTHSKFKKDIAEMTANEHWATSSCDDFCYPERKAAQKKHGSTTP